MRYPEAHAATSGSVPFMLRGPKSVRTALAAAVAGAIGLMPVVFVASPAQADLAGWEFVNDDITVTEGRDITFQLTRPGDADTAMPALTLDWSVGGDDDTATPTDDVTPASGSVTFPADSTVPYAAQTMSIVVHTVDDKLDEEAESFTLTVDDGDGGTLTAKGTITDNDLPPTYKLIVDDANPDEGSGRVSVYAKLNAPSGIDVSIPIATANGTAKADQDYTPIADDTKLTIPAGETESDPETVTITDDKVYEEAKQAFTIKGTTDPTVSGTATTTVNIVDNEDQPTVTIAPPDAAGDEGTNLGFEVSLSGSSERAVTVDWATADGPGKDKDASDVEDHGIAVGGSDYTVASGTVTFAASSDDAAPDAKPITVRTSLDSLDELSPEDMHVTLSKPTIAALGDDTEATGSITDLTDPPSVTLQPTNATITEGNAGRKAQTFTVRLNKASGKKVAISYATGDADDNQATPGSDYISAKGKLIFNPGDTQKTFTVDIVGDTMLEDDEDFAVTLTSDDDDMTVPEPTTYHIKNDDKNPTFSVTAQTVKEGSEGSVVVVPVKLSSPLTENASFTVAVENDGATAAEDAPGPGEIDYVVPADTVSIPAGQTTGYVYFLVVGDDVYEPDEKLNIKVTPDTPADVVAGGEKSATVTITNDDAAPSLEIVNQTVEEGDSAQIAGVTNGVSQHDVPVTITVKGASAGGSVAATSTDFVDPGPFVFNIPGGAISGSTVDVGDPIDISDDTTAEPDETLSVTGAGVGGVGTVKPGVLTIAANDNGATTPPGGTAPTIDVPANIKGAFPVSITGKATANATVELWGAPISAAKPALAKLLTTTAKADGSYSFSRWIGQGYRFAAKVGTEQTDEKQVTVTQDPVFVASSTKGMLSLAVQGSPRGGGQTVIVQSWEKGAWVNKWRGTTVGNDPWKTSVKLPSGTALALRAFVAGSTPDGILPGYTEVTRLTVK